MWVRKFVAFHKKRPTRIPQGKRMSAGEKRKTWAHTLYVRYKHRSTHVRYKHRCIKTWVRMLATNIGAINASRKKLSSDKKCTACKPVRPSGKFERSVSCKPVWEDVTNTFPKEERRRGQEGMPLATPSRKMLQTHFPKKNASAAKKVPKEEPKCGMPLANSSRKMLQTRREGSLVLTLLGRLRCRRRSLFPRSRRLRWWPSFRRSLFSRSIRIF